MSLWVNSFCWWVWFSSLQSRWVEFVWAAKAAKIQLWLTNQSSREINQPVHTSNQPTGTINQPT